MTVRMPVVRIMWCHIIYVDVDDRLLLSVRRPSVVNSTFDSLTVGMFPVVRFAWFFMVLNVPHACRFLHGTKFAGVRV